MGLISISIDIGGSTALKNRIIDISKGKEEIVTRFYKSYIHRLLILEKNFYFHLKNTGQLDLLNLFLIKGIGDELWYVYDTNDISQNTIKFAVDPM